MRKFLILIVLGAAGAAGYWYWQQQQLATATPAATPAMSKPGGGKPAGPKTLKALRLQEQPVTVYSELPGRTTAYEQADIRPQVGGLITKRLFQEGSLVKQGQQLYQIDAAPYQASYDSALADLEKARTNVESIKTRLQRYQELLKINAVSKQDYDDIQTSLAPAVADIAIAEAKLTQARINLEYTRVLAPISGRIGKSSVSIGSLVTAGQSQSLTRITQLDPIYVDIAQSSEALLSMRQRYPDTRKIPIRLLLGESGREYEQTGKIQFYDVNVDQSTGSVNLRALFPNPKETLLPGLFVRAQLAFAHPKALLVPQYAASRAASGELQVWVVDDNNTAQQVNISAKATVDDQWLVTEGLQVGDVVLIEGMLKLKAGDAVKPVFEDLDSNSDNTKPSSGQS